MCRERERERERECVCVCVCCVSYFLPRAPCLLCSVLLHFLVVAIDVRFELLPLLVEFVHRLGVMGVCEIRGEKRESTQNKQTKNIEKKNKNKKQNKTKKNKHIRT